MLRPNNQFYMASSVNQIESNSALLWLATQKARQMALSCTLGTTCCVPQKKFARKSYNKSLIDLLRWLDIGLVLSACEFMDLDSVSVLVWTWKKERGQYPAISPHTWSILTHISCLTVLLIILLIFFLDVCLGDKMRCWSISDWSVISWSNDVNFE